MASPKLGNNAAATASLWANNSPSSSIHTSTEAVPVAPVSQPPPVPSAPSNINFPRTLCTNPMTLKHFLSTSRWLDDNLSSQLNTLSLTSHSLDAARHLPNAREVPRPVCESFVQSTLLPTWKQRTAALEFCEGVYKEEVEKAEKVQKEKEEEMVVDERLDPYSARVPIRVSSWVENLESVLRVERGVERVIRQRTKGIVWERCGIIVDQ